MIHNIKIRNTIAVVTALVILVAAVPIDVKSQVQEPGSGNAEWVVEPPKAPNSSASRSPFESKPNFAPPPGGGDANKEFTPIHSGFWILTGLAMVYGIVRRNQRKES